MTIGHVIPTDNRGKHSNRMTISDEAKVAIKEHFFGVLKSPTVSFKDFKSGLLLITV